MDLKRIKSKKGFTLIELMVVIVIIGILVAIALPNFIAAQDRAKLSSVKANMHTVQTMLETYAVDWGGIYAHGATPPDAVIALNAEAAAKNYSKDFKNPFVATAAALVGLPTATTITTTGANVGTLSAAGTGGATYYNPTGTTSVTKYYLYGGEKENLKVIVDKGQVFYLTNS